MWDVGRSLGQAGGAPGILARPILKGGNDGGEGQEDGNRESSDLGQAEAEEKDLSREVIAGAV